MRRLVVLAITLAALVAIPALAAGPPGPDIPLNSTTADQQKSPDIAPLPGSAFVAAWVSENQNGTADGVYHRRFDATGSPQTGELLVDENANNTQGEVSISSAPDGRFVVAWSTYFSSGGAGNEVRARAYDANGSPVGGEFQVNTTTAGSQRAPDVAMAPDGSFVVVWAAYGGSPGTGQVIGRRYGAGGAGPSAEITVGAAQADDSVPRVAIETDGAFVVTWTDYSLTLGDVRVRRFTAMNDPVFDARTVHDATAGTQDYSDVAITSEGFVVAWSTTEINARRFGPDGTPLAGQVTVNEVTSGSQDVPFLAVAPDGTLSVAFNSGDTVVSRRLDAALAPLGGDVAVPQSPGTSEYSAAVIPLSDAFITAWQGSDDDGTGVFARRHPFDASAPPSAPPPPAPIPVAAPVPPPAPVAASKPAKAKPLTLTSVALLPATRKCVSRRKFQIRLRHPRGTRIKTAVVKLNKKRVATRKGRRVTATVNLRGLPRGRFTVEITVTLANEKTISGKRSYRTCSSKKSKKPSTR